MLKKRFIRTTITIRDEKKIFVSKDGRFDGKVTMRQDFKVKAFVNIGASGLHTAEIKLYNLTDATTKAIEEQSTLVLLEAGWEDSYGRLFEGRISSVGRTKPTVSNADIVTTLYCVSGIEKLQLDAFGETVRSESLRSFLSRMADRLDLFLSIDSAVQGNIIDMSFNGDVISVVRDLATEFNFDFYMTQTSLVVKAIDLEELTKLGDKIKTYDPTKGLLDIPVVTELGIDLKVFLDPFLNPGDWFLLSSKFANFNIGNLEFIDRVRGQQFKTFGRQVNNNRYQGDYRALEILHFGSSHEDSWESLIKGQGLYNINNINKIKRLGIS